MTAAKTPETDEARDRCANCGLQFVPADVCEKLEAQRDALADSLQHALVWMETEIRNEYDGTSMLQDRLAELSPFRAALKSARGE